MDRWMDKCKFEIGCMDLCKFEKVFVVSQMYDWMDGLM